MEPRTLLKKSMSIFRVKSFAGQLSSSYKSDPLLRIGLLVIAAVSWQSSTGAAQRPNILWITCEDTSPHLGCYGDAEATTPNLDRLAAEGVRFTRAHHVHAVCAPARTGVITGMYPTSLGCNHMRSKGRLPAEVKPFPYYLRAAGYYTTNNVKTDYNFHWNESEVWHENSRRAHWRNRQSREQPFFAVFNITLSHESQVWRENHALVVKDLPKNLLHDPAKMKLPPYYPDTPKVRETVARLYDVITAMDVQVGKILRQLEADGLSEDTIVMFWSDHGDGLPRAKRWLYNSGTRVPMIVRIPERFRTGEYGRPGSTDDRLISMIDLAPTVLRLAGVEVPPHFQGQPFLGDDKPAPRRYVHAARDRIDERYDMVRMVRDDRYLYLRTYMPWYPALAMLDYAEKNEIRQEMRRLLAEGELTPVATQYFSVPRPYEQLFDTQADPDEVNNLADDGPHAEVLARLRAECDQWMLETGDAHFVAEPFLDDADVQFGNRRALVAGPDAPVRLRRLMEVAGTVASGTADVDTLAGYLADADPAVRWWAAMGLGNEPARAKEAESTLRGALSDKSVVVRVAVARALDRAGHTDAALTVLSKALGDKNPATALWAMSVLDEMDERARPALPVIQAAAGEQANEYVMRVAKAALRELLEPVN
jgi:uncharacterized sulfatase